MCRLITSTELDRLSETELSVLFNKVSGHLNRTDPGTPERRNCLASLENIERKVIQRRKLPETCLQKKDEGNLLRRCMHKSCGFLWAWSAQFTSFRD